MMKIEIVDNKKVNISSNDLYNCVPSKVYRICFAGESSIWLCVMNYNDKDEDTIQFLHLETMQFELASSLLNHYDKIDYIEEIKKMKIIVE